jgi:hypothetical protein
MVWMSRARQDFWVRHARMAILLLAATVPACVVGAETRPPRERVVRGAWLPRSANAVTHLAAHDRVLVRDPGDEPGAESGTTGGASPATSPEPPDDEMQWMAPYAHWNGVEYRFVPATRERRAPDYTWRAPRTD